MMDERRRARRTTSTRPPAVAYLTTPDENTAATVPGHSPDQEAWLGRIQYYGRRQMWRKAEEKFHQMKQEGVQPTLAICHALLEGFLKAKRYENAVSLLERMCIEYCRGGGDDGDSDGSRPADDTDVDGVAQPVLPDLRTFNLVLATLASGGKFSRALQLSAPLREPRSGALRSPSTVDGVDGGGVGRGTRKVTAAKAVASVAANIVADGETYTHLIVACGKGSELKRARALFEEMQGNGIVPPPEASAALIRGLGRGGADSSEVMSLLADLNASADEETKGRRKRGRAQGREDDDDQGGEGASLRTVRALGYKGAIEACAGEGDWRKAVLLLDEMRSANVIPDSHCYGNAMRACVRDGNWQLALALLNTMKKEQVQRTAFNYNVAMQACRKSGKYNKSLRLLEEMECDGVQPDIVTYNTVVTIMAKAGRLEDALEVLRKASADSGVQLDVVSYRVVLGGLRQEKQWEAAVKLLADMEMRGLGPDERCIAMGMNACVAAREPQRAIDLFEGMREAGEVFPGLTSVTALLGALAVMGRWQDALGELRALSASGVKPDSKAIGHVMTACNKARKWDETLALHAYANKMGVDSTMENMVLVAKAHGGRRDCQGVIDVLALAEQLCQAATQDGGQELKKRVRQPGATSRSTPLHPSADLYEAAARSLARAGMWEQAVNALRKLERLPSARDGRTPAASRNTYELVMEAVAKAEHHEAVLEQGELARAALREHRHPSRPEHAPGDDADRSPASAVNDSPGKKGRESDSREIEELSPLALALEVSSAGKLGLWDRVSSVMSKALVSPSLRGVAGARLYNALIGAAVSCGRPQRGLDVFREMEEEAAGRGGGGHTSKSNLKQSRRYELLPGCGPLPVPDLGTFMATLDACAAVGGEESITLAIGVTKSAAAATGDAADSARRLPLRKLAVVLNRAGEVCASSGADSAGTALMAKARELASDGLEPGDDDSDE